MLPTIDPVATEKECFNLYSAMEHNALQSYSGSPDRDAKGFTTCKLCTDGEIKCDALVYGGKSPLIASHIHRSSTGDGSTGEGAPVLSFCGDNTNGLINLKTDYPRACSAYDSSKSNNPGMKGVFLLSDENKGLSVADRVRDIGQNPEK
jgi:hypothetical protein